MTTRNIDIDIDAMLEARQFTRAVGRLDQQISGITRASNRIARAVASAPRGGVGRAAGAAGRGAGAVGRTVGAGAGLGAGLAIAEQLLSRLFELFEGSDILETFTEALDSILKAAAPIAGVLINALIPTLLALFPAITPVAKALTPLIELLGGGLVVAVQLITPGIILWARALEYVTTFIRDTAFKLIQFVVDQLNKLPFIDIDFKVASLANSFDKVAKSISDTNDETERKDRIDKDKDKELNLRAGPSSYSAELPNVSVYIDSRDVAARVDRRTRTARQRSREYPL